jgi:hypothetical protein
MSSEILGGFYAYFCLVPGYWMMNVADAPTQPGAIGWDWIMTYMDVGG